MALTDLFLTTSTDWRHDAVCRRHEPELWWVDDPHHHITKLAVEACGICPVRAACLEFALENRETYGVWGGLTAAQRKAVLRQRQRQAVA